MPSAIEKGHIPDCLNHTAVGRAVRRYNLNSTSGKTEQQEWVTSWLSGCPHRKPGGNAVLYSWNCNGCFWKED